MTVYDSDFSRASILAAIRDNLDSVSWGYSKQTRDIISDLTDMDEALFGLFEPGNSAAPQDINDIAEETRRILSDIDRRAHEKQGAARFSKDLKSATSTALEKQELTKRTRLAVLKRVIDYETSAISHCEVSLPTIDDSDKPPVDKDNVDNNRGFASFCGCLVPSRQCNRQV